MSREPPFTPSNETRKTAVRPLRELRGGLVARLDYGLSQLQIRWRGERLLRERARQVVGLVQERQAWSDENIGTALQSARQHLLRARARRNPAAEQSALAGACVLAARTIPLEPYPEQILGAVGLLEGQLMEMATGEGKTLALALASVPAALGGRAHLVLTANDYLAARDAQTVGPLYARCGLRVGVVTGPMATPERKLNYACDIVYTTARELVADFLRDRLHYQHLQDGDRRLIRALFQGAPMPFEGVVLRGIESVFVDEADYVLIDEAVTPLIISAQQENPLLESLVTEVFARARVMQAGRDYRLRPHEGRVELTGAATQELERRWQPRHPVLQGARRRPEWVRHALEAMHLFVRDQHYLVRDDKVHIIDQTLGRILPNRTWSQGTHQFVELKEQVSLSKPTHTITGISFQNFFRLVPRLAGVSGTLVENASEFYWIYGLAVVRVPLHRAGRRTRRAPHIFRQADEKFRAAAGRVLTLHRTGQPVLVGTLSVRVSERMARALDELGLPYRLLNAAQDREEAEIIARAGEPGAITLATNMAGRGVDIRLGPGMEQLGGLCVLQLERNPAHRVDRQLYGRCARQGERGCVEIFTSIDEDHLAGPDWALNRWLERIGSRFLRTPVGRAVATIYINHCQRRAERRAREQRMALRRRDRWLEEAIG